MKLINGDEFLRLIHAATESDGRERIGDKDFLDFKGIKRLLEKAKFTPADLAAENLTALAGWIKLKTAVDAIRVNSYSHEAIQVLDAVKQEIADLESRHALKPEEYEKMRENAKAWQILWSPRYTLVTMDGRVELNPQFKEKILTLARAELAEKGGKDESV